MVELTWRTAAVAQQVVRLRRAAPTSGQSSAVVPKVLNFTDQYEKDTYRRRRGEGRETGKGQARLLKYTYSFDFG